MLPKFPEHKLNLAFLWFTGKEWLDGTAERILEQQYIDAERRILSGGVNHFSSQVSCRKCDNNQDLP